MIIQSLITAWLSPFSCKGTDDLIYGFNGKKMCVSQGINHLLLYNVDDLLILNEFLNSSE